MNDPRARSLKPLKELSVSRLSKLGIVTPEVKLLRKRYKKVAREKSRDFVKKYLNEHPCTVCGESSLACLDFDHIDKSQKKRCIAEMIFYGCSVRTIQNEIDKCNVLCSNCHRKKHALEYQNGIWAAISQCDRKQQNDKLG